MSLTKEVLGIESYWYMILRYIIDNGTQSVYNIKHATQVVYSKFVWR